MLMSMIRRVVLAVSLAIVTAPYASAQPALPETQVGKLAALYFDANNSLDPDRLAAFLTAHLPAGLANPQFPEVQQSGGGFDVLSVDKTTEDRLTLTVRTRKTDIQYRMIFILDGEDAQKLRLIGMGFF